MIRRNVLLAKKNPNHRHSNIDIHLDKHKFMLGDYTLSNLRIVNGDIYGDIEGPRKIVDVQAFCEFTESRVSSFSIYDDICDPKIHLFTLSYYYYKCRVSLNSERMEI